MRYAWSLGFILALAGGCNFFNHHKTSAACDTVDVNGDCVAEGPCYSSWDCLVGSACVDGTCAQTNTCVASSDCPKGENCDDRSTCVAVGSTTCKTDSDCATRDFCDTRGGYCVPSVYCTSSAQCGSGWKCDSRNTCTLISCSSDSDCDRGLYCSSSVCVESATCRTDADCFTGTTCNTSRNTCEPKATGPTGPTGATGVTGPTGNTCTKDTDCPTDYACVSGTCKAGGVSIPQDTCTNSLQCDNGMCLQNSVGQGLCHRNCTDSSQCGTGDYCTEGGYCDKNPNPTAQCVVPNDCGGLDWTCINSVCHKNCTTGPAGDAYCKNYSQADFCDQGICQPDWRANSNINCKLDSDCVTGDQCVNGTCSTRCIQNQDCATSVNGLYCNMGYCSMTASGPTGATGPT
jgi:hypothetical protein